MPENPPSAEETTRITARNAESWRPQPDDRSAARPIERVRLGIERLRSRPPRSGGDQPDDSGAPRRRFGNVRAPVGSWLYAALIAIGSALLTIGAIFAFQSWSARSALPIDDLLPMADSADVSEVQASATVEVATTVAAMGPPPEPRLPQQPASGDLATEPGRIIVHVSGAVDDPGVVRLEVGSRVFEAVELAGGSTSSADLERVNLAAPLVDGERIHVPTIGQHDVPEVVLPDRTVIVGPEPGVTPLTVVDVNQATLAELQSLPGVGPATAAAIVRTREERGSYLTIEDLLAVPGIAETRLEQLRPYVQILNAPRS